MVSINESFSIFLRGFFLGCEVGGILGQLHVIQSVLAIALCLAMFGIDM